ncbi:hypothetical protein [Sessilibacter corallicola]|uniref:hypothetical protein n=1 Tax=Sessilibacter corallicola TaxID=2904075 RepID=UPI001E5F8780|nr:hypothetical protein [Sessilibacter corallicola]MCE2027752.1 hypothetical protein [Sessilibacter corallicola]
MHYFEELVAFILVVSVTVFYLNSESRICWQISFMEMSIEITKGNNHPNTSYNSDYKLEAGIEQKENEGLARFKKWAI